MLWSISHQHRVGSIITTETGSNFGNVGMGPAKRGQSALDPQVSAIVSLQAKCQSTGRQEAISLEWVESS